MPRVRFKVGDRVTVRYPQQLPAGTVGTVVRVYDAVQEGYDVAFGDHPLALLWGPELDRVVDAPPPIAQTRPPSSRPRRVAPPHTSARPARRKRQAASVLLSLDADIPMLCAVIVV
jgi:hypothetical protein